MITIYGIEDINDLIYVGSTKQKLNRRLTAHRNDKRINHYCSSSKLNLDYCIIYELEKCNEEDRKEREQYWIDKLDCVNDNNTIFDRKEYDKNNKEQIAIYKRQWYIKNKQKIREQHRQYYLKKKSKQ